MAVSSFILIYPNIDEWRTGRRDPSSQSGDYFSAAVSWASLCSLWNPDFPGFIAIAAFSPDLNPVSMAGVGVFPITGDPDLHFLVGVVAAGIGDIPEPGIIAIAWIAMVVVRHSGGMMNHRNPGSGVVNMWTIMVVVVTDCGTGDDSGDESSDCGNCVVTCMSGGGSEPEEDCCDDDMANLGFHGFSIVKFTRSTPRLPALFN
jgi:hypothetical protein